MSSPLTAVRLASRALAQVDAVTINALLEDLANAIVEQQDILLSANIVDCTKMHRDDPKYDRLLLSEERLEGIAKEVRAVAALPSPLGITVEERDVPSGLHIQKVTVPLGVVGVIYEARPNVTADVSALCLKSGNAVVLKGGSDAAKSNKAFVDVIHTVLKKHNLPTDLVHLLPPEREAVTTLLEATGDVDVIIPRGSQSLIEFVRQNAKVPVIETGAGIVHTYVDASADTKKAQAIVFNAKTRRPSVCNALDTLIIHRAKLADLSTIVQPCAEKKVEIFADADAYAALDGSYPAGLLQKAKKEHFGTEFLSLKMSIKTVEDLDEALEHIVDYGSKHSEAIVAEDKETIKTFLHSVDAAAVYANASTAFTDGAQFGLGAEIGISTQKLHARGPMGLRELTSYTWIVRGNGQIRP